MKNKSINHTQLAHNGYLFKILGSDKLFYTKVELPTLNNQETILVEHFFFKNISKTKSLHLFFKDGIPITFTRDVNAHFVGHLKILKVEGKPNVRNRIAVEILKYNVGDYYNDKIIKKIGSRWKSKKRNCHLEYIYI